MLPHLAQERVDIAPDALGTLAGIGYEFIARATGLAFGFGVEHLVSQITDLFAQAFEAVTKTTTELASFFGGQ